MLLKFLRKRKNMKRIMWILAILIIPAFVIWGTGSGSKKREKGPDYAGKIFNKKISFEEYVDMWNVVRDYALKNLGDNIPPEFIDEMVWNRIILLEEARREHIQTTDAEVVEKIASFPIFQRNGVFDKKLYKSMLGDNARGFEERLRDDVLISKLKEKILLNISINDEELKNSYKENFEKIKISYILIPFTDFEKDVRYEETDLINFYNSNKQNFKKGEQANVKYIEIPFSKFDNDVHIKDEDIQKYFEEHLSDFKKPDSAETPVLDDNIKKDITTKLTFQRKKSLAEELAYKVLDQVLLQKNLEEPAKSNSLKTQETGFFTMDQEIPEIGWSYEFTKASFELKAQEIHNLLIKSNKGFYIIQLKQKKDPYIPPFAEAKDSVKKSYIKENSVKLAQRQIEKLSSNINNDIKNGLSFEDAVKKQALTSKQTDFITRDGYIPELGPANELAETAFSLKIGGVSRPIKTLEGWVVLKPLEYQGIDEAKFLEEKDKFKEELLSRKKEGAFNQWLENLKRRAQFVSFTTK